ncbi:putative exocyst complex component EXOC2/Sec5 [Helianthus annuus]|nr:putative exocyst complex component EXOC2/Sec5 [Helianthus annuus]
MSDSDEEEVPQKVSNGKSRKSKAKKPVKNFMQTIGNRIPKAKKKKNKKKQQPSKPRVPDDDDDEEDDEESEDSEVEMLSISSGDDEQDSTVDKKPKADDNKLPEGVEPTKWKHVNESELALRVRAMRESKAVPAPVVQKIERKQTQGLNNMQSLPRGMECIDPLGLGIISSRTMRLITERTATEPSNNEYMDADLRGIHPLRNNKLTFFSERFDPVLFISRIHQFTSAADLEAGTLALKTDLKGWTQQRKQLVKENFDCFVSCKTTIDDIESKLKRIEEDPEGGSSYLETSIQGINSMANRAFEPLLERQVYNILDLKLWLRCLFMMNKYIDDPFFNKAQADKIRAVQGTLQRFRTLFSLPSAFRGNIRKGEYDLAVREYRKANSIVLPTHAGILKRVLEEVEKVMHDFKRMLYESMEDPHIDLTNLENTVRLLLELEPESDPVRRYFGIQNRRIRILLENCTVDHESRMDHLQNKLNEKALLDENWKTIQQDLHESVDGGLVNSQPTNSGSEELDALRGRYIRRLTAVIIHLILPFWKVALSVSSGKFGKVFVSIPALIYIYLNIIGLNIYLQILYQSSPEQNKSEEKAQGRYFGHSLEVVTGMIHEIISAYESKVQVPSAKYYHICCHEITVKSCQKLEVAHSFALAIFLPTKICLNAQVQNTFLELEEANVICPYMSDAIMDISKACQAFDAKEAAPATAVESLRSLLFESTKLYIMKLCSWMRTSIDEESRNESWVPVTVLERNKSPYAISSLPLAFRSIMVAAMDRIDVCVKILHLSRSLGQMEQIGGELGQIKENENGYYSHVEEENLFHHRHGSITDPQQQLLMVLSNIGFCKDDLFGEMYNKYKHVCLKFRYVPSTLFFHSFTLIKATQSAWLAP